MGDRDRRWGGAQDGQVRAELVEVWAVWGRQGARMWVLGARLGLGVLEVAMG